MTPSRIDRSVEHSGMLNPRALSSTDCILIDVCSHVSAPFMRSITIHKRFQHVFSYMYLSWGVIMVSVIDWRVQLLLPKVGEVFISQASSRRGLPLYLTAPVLPDHITNASHLLVPPSKEFCCLTHDVLICISFSFPVLVDCFAEYLVHHAAVLAPVPLSVPHLLYLPLDFLFHIPSRHNWRIPPTFHRLQRLQAHPQMAQQGSNPGYRLPRG